MKITKLKSIVDNFPDHLWLAMNAYQIPCAGFALIEGDEISESARFI